MKTTFCVLAAIFAMGFWWFDLAYLPDPRTNNKEVGTTGAGTKVAMIDISVVFEKYSRAIEFREDLEDLIQPYEVKAAKDRNEMA